MAKNEATLILRLKTIGEKALKTVKDGLRSIGDTAKVASVAIAGFVAAGVTAFRQQELAVNRLNQAMVNNGDFTEEASQDLQKFASQLQKTSTFGDETIISMLSLAKSFGVSNEEAKKMITAATNLASATGMSLESAVKNLGKTMGGLTGELGESVPALRGLTQEQLMAGAAIDLVAEKFAGANEATIQGTGSIEQLSNLLGDFLETVGQAFAPFIVEITKSLSTFTTATIENSTALSGLQTVALNISRIFVVLKNGIMATAGVIGTALAAAVEATTAAVSLNFDRAKEIAALGIEETGALLKESVSVTTDELLALDAAVEQQQKARQQRNLQLVKQSVKTRGQLEKKAKTEAITLEQKKQAELLGIELKGMKTREQAQAAIDKARVNARGQTLGRIASLTQSNNATLRAIGKAATIAQVAIETPKAIATALAAFPPPFNFAAAGAVGAAMAVQAARAAALEDGGIVRATPGGTLARIGEGGRDEAVVPLEAAGGSPLGNNINITVVGGLLGDRETARELAIAIDEELLKLRRDNESVAFDTGIV